jgi:hypothetical protein
LIKIPDFGICPWANLSALQGVREHDGDLTMTVACDKLPSLEVCWMRSRQGTLGAYLKVCRVMTATNEPSKSSLFDLVVETISRNSLRPRTGCLGHEPTKAGGAYGCNEIDARRKYDIKYK